jgi:rSAM/selenodomain-associated transferase 2/rSAM/selenodomain-associated transferase 1
VTFRGGRLVSGLGRPGATDVTLGVVVPALDEAARIAAALDALAPLRAAGHHVVVVDGGSGDETVALARSRADLVLVGPRGRAVQMNVGAHAARGAVLLFLHADARLPDGAAAAIERALANGAQWGRFDVTLEGRSRWLPLVAASMNARSAATGICTGDQAVFVRRDAFEAVGGFPAIALMEDIALSAELKARFGPPARLRERVVVSGRRWDRRGALRTIASMWRLRHAYWRGADPDGLARRYYGLAPPSRPVLQVFAKASVPGRVKTRLAQSIGAEEAARAYGVLAENTLGVAAAARRAGVVGAVELWVEPGAPAGSFDQWMRAFDVSVHEQRGADLGERMHAALRDALARGHAALLIGTDVPGYDVPYFAQAAAALDSRDAVIGPAEDSGYVLIGLARDADAFSGIAWSTREVLDATRARLRDAGLRWHELPLLWDVDTHDDWQRWRQEVTA